MLCFFVLALPVSADADVVSERGEAYKEFLERGATAKMSIAVAKEWAERKGFRAVDPLRDGACKSFSPGDKLTFLWQERTALFVRVGTKPIADGVAIVGAHVDAPALRLTAEPIQSGKGGGTHLSAYTYGGIKPFHYRDRPLRLVGNVVRADGSSVDIDLGSKQGFVFVASALDTAEKRSNGGLGAERKRRDFKVVVSTGGVGTDDKPVSFLEELESRFGVTRDDLKSAELYAVNAQLPRDVGFDRSIIGGAGQDDRSLSFAALSAVLEMNDPTHTAAAFLVDREEIGSTGRSGARAPMLEEALSCLAKGRGASSAKLDSLTRDALSRSAALSTDVKSAINPNWSEVQDHKNAPTMGKGPTLVKFTGSRGKKGASDAHPELSRYVRNVAAKAKLPLQRSETGKVDEGGGGTIAKYIAERGVDVIDVGVPLLSMHAPFELVSKADLSWCVDLFRAFLEAGPPNDK
jgi:aspartyl aminopeptidase